LTVDAFGSEEA